MGTDDPPMILAPESVLRGPPAGESRLLQLRTDRRLGHEWDDWDGEPLPDGGVFNERETVFFALTGAAIVSVAVAAWAVIWLLEPRLASLFRPLPVYLSAAVTVVAALALGWLLALAVVLRTRSNWLPERLAERGLVPWIIPKLEWLAMRVGMSRDRVGNACLRVYNRLAAARSRTGFAPDDLLILLPRCLSKSAMQAAMEISSRYGVPMFVAARGRYARQMIGMRRPRGIVAVACERDLVSGVHDVAHRLPVLGTTLRLGDGPCRNTEFTAVELEDQIKRMLGLTEAG